MKLYMYDYTVTDDGELIINKSEKHECLDIDEALEIAGNAYREMREARCDWWPDIPAIPEEFDQIFSDLLTWEYTEVEQTYGTMSMEALGLVKWEYTEDDIQKLRERSSI